MVKSRFILAAGLVLAGLAFGVDRAEAGGRMYFGGHPYHNGYYFIPPSSAYEAPSLMPPPRYGIPAYYIPSSYLAPGVTYYPMADYPYVPVERAAGYYMSAHAYQYAYPW